MNGLAKRAVQLAIILSVVAIALNLLFLGLLSLLKENLKPVAVWTAGQAGYSIEAAKMEWREETQITVEDFAFADFARIEKMDVRWNWDGLAQRELEEVRIHGARVIASGLARTAEAGKGGPKGSNPYRIKKLIISHSTLVLDTLGAGLPPIPLRIAETPPALVLHNVVMGGDTSDPAARLVQSAVIQDFKIYSPFDPTSRVLEFQEIFLQFTWEGIQQRRLEKLVFHKPIIYVGQDLFWFANQVKEKGTAAQSAAPIEPWHIGEFAVEEGSLAVSMDGEPRFTIPGQFYVRPTPLEVGDFSKLHLKTEFRSNIEQLDYPEYGLRLSGITADLDFNLPISDDRQFNNIVRTFTIEELEWKGLRFGSKDSPGWVSLTFDPDGFYGQFGAPGYEGYLSGGMSIDLKNDFQWLAWGAVADLETGPVTQLLSPRQFVLTGPVEGAFKVSGHRREILGFGGRMKLLDQGTLHVDAIDDAIANIPADWPLIKQDLMRILLEAFRDYEYTEGVLEFTYTPDLSFLRLNMDGAQGRRNFNINWNDQRTVLTPLYLPSP